MTTAAAILALRDAADSDGGIYQIDTDRTRLHGQVLGTVSASGGGVRFNFRPLDGSPRLIHAREVYAVQREGTLR